MTLRSVHADFAWVVLISNAIVGLWALGAHHDRRFQHRLLWPATIVAELLVAPALEAGRLRANPIDLPPRDYVLMHHRDRHASNAQQALVEHLIS